jgi:hypothetical protein
MAKVSWSRQFCFFIMFMSIYHVYVLVFNTRITIACGSVSYLVHINDFSFLTVGESLWSAWHLIVKCRWYILYRSIYACICYRLQDLLPQSVVSWFHAVSRDLCALWLTLTSFRFPFIFIATTTHQVPLLLYKLWDLLWVFNCYISCQVPLINRSFCWNDPLLLQSVSPPVSCLSWYEWSHYFAHLYFCILLSCYL